MTLWHTSLLSERPWAKWIITYHTVYNAKLRGFKHFCKCWRPNEKNWRWDLNSGPSGQQTNALLTELTSHSHKRQSKLYPSSMGQRIFNRTLNKNIKQNYLVIKWKIKSWNQQIKAYMLFSWISHDYSHLRGFWQKLSTKYCYLNLFSYFCGPKKLWMPKWEKKPGLELQTFWLADKHSTTWANKLLMQAAIEIVSKVYGP